MVKVRNKIVLIGPLPPPMGGVSIHLKRLSFLLGEEFEIDYIDESYTIKDKYFNLRRFNLIKYLRKISWSDLIFIHSGGKLLKIFHIIIGKLFKKKIIITLHSYPINRLLCLKFWDEFFIIRAETIVIVNPDILKRISLPSEKCIIQPAFIPPIIAHEPSLPYEVINWIEKRKKEGNKIICANASQLVSSNGHDLYGLDMCIDVAKQLVNHDYKVSFIFIVASIKKHRELFLDYISIIEKYDLKENFFLINTELSFVKLIEMSDIVLRPTNTDGDALTIREALYLGKPIIASDIVDRPNGTILFKTRDVMDMKRKIMKTIKIWPTNIQIQEQNDLMEYQRFYTNMIKNTILKTRR